MEISQARGGTRLDWENSDCWKLELSAALPPYAQPNLQGVDLLKDCLESAGLSVSWVSIDRERLTKEFEYDSTGGLVLRVRGRKKVARGGGIHKYATLQNDGRRMSWRVQAVKQWDGWKVKEDGVGRKWPGPWSTQNRKLGGERSGLSTLGVPTCSAVGSH